MNNEGEDYGALKCGAYTGSIPQITNHSKNRDIVNAINSWPRAVSASSKLFSIEAMRGLAALAVAWFHLVSRQEDAFVRACGSYGGLGVQAFFVISGFVIPYSLEKYSYTIKLFPKFIARRMVRLEPPYLISIALILVAGLLSSVPQPINSAQVALHFLYLIPLSEHAWLNAVYWTLAYEFGFYLFVGAFWPFLRDKPLGVTFLATAVTCGLLSLVGGTEQTIILLFFIGIAGFRYHAGTSSRAELLIFGAASELILLYFKGPEYCVVSILVLSVILFVKVPEYKFLSFLGAISYSLYLIHEPIGGRIISISQRFGTGTVYEFFASVVALLASIAAASVFYALIEAPAHRFAKRIRMT